MTREKRRAESTDANFLNSKVDCKDLGIAYLNTLDCIASRGAPMDQYVTIEEGGVRIGLELTTSVSENHLDLLRPSARFYSLLKGNMTNAADMVKGKYTSIQDEDDSQLGMYEKPLPCFGCGIGWFSFLLGFLCPLLWYYATILYLRNYYRKDPRERAGLAASAIAAMGCSVILLLVAIVLLFNPSN